MRRRGSVPIVLIVVAISMSAVISGCSGEPVTESEVVGVVTEVTGDLSGIESFVVLNTDGESYKFTPINGMTVMGAPMAHIRDHLVSGEPVIVEYNKSEDGGLIAYNVMHAED